MVLGYLVFTFGCLLSSSFIMETLGRCPPESLIRPCTCNRNTLVCSDITEQSVLDGVFRRLGNNRLTEFILKNSQVDHLIASSLKTNYFRKIRVVDSALFNIFDGFPPAQNQLNHFGLDNVNINNGFHEEYLQPLTKLEYLTITKTVIPKFDKEFNMYLSDKIKRVGLYLTETQSIDYAFVGKSELEAVSIHNDSLISINRVTFPYPANKLSMLTLDGNQIDSLEQDQFTYMPALRVLSFAGNKISHVTEEVFGEIYDQLQLLDLSGNPIICDCSIQWISTRNSEGKTAKGECTAPTDLAGKQIADLKSTDFTSCPNENS